MGLEIVVKKTEEGGDRAAPVIKCDYCGKVIDDANDGNYHWTFGDPRITFSHKRCFRGFEQTHVGDELLLTSGLEPLPIFLAINLDLNWREAWESAYWYLGHSPGDVPWEDVVDRMLGR